MLTKQGGGVPAEAAARCRSSVRWRWSEGCVVDWRWSEGWWECRQHPPIKADEGQIRPFLLHQAVASDCETARESLPRKAVETGVWVPPTGLLV